MIPIRIWFSLFNFCIKKGSESNSPPREFAPPSRRPIIPVCLSLAHSAAELPVPAAAPVVLQVFKVLLRSKMNNKDAEKISAKLTWAVSIGGGLFVSLVGGMALHTAC